MKFEKYTSLTNSYKQKTVNHLIDNGFGNVAYWVSEKIHGANFGVHLNVKSGEVRFSKRTSFLGTDSCFYSCHLIESELTDYITTLFNSIGSACDETLSVYGEIFGGSFYGEQEGGSKRVQSGVEYSTKTEFAAFDVKVDDTYLPPSSFIHELEEAGFYVVPTLGFTETLQEALDITNTFESVVPSALGFAAKDGNISEGKVIRPFTKDLLTPDGSRIILKDKTPSFSEKSSKPKKVVVELPKEGEEVLNSISEFITHNRLMNVISKEEDLTQKDFGRIMGLLTQDALSDYYSDNLTLPSVFKEEHKVYWKELIKEINKESSQIVRDYWKQEF